MSISRFLTLGSIAALLLLASCGKKESSDEKKPAATKEVVKEEKKADLFDEYYEGDKKDTNTVAETPVNEVTDKTIEEDTGLVEELTNEKSDSEEKVAPDFDPNGRYVAQISCIASEAIAEDVAKKLENSGYPVYVAEVVNPTPQLLGTYYRVRVGGFATISAAKYFGENFLLPEGYSYWIDNRSNDNVGIGDYGLGGATSNIFEDEPVKEEKVFKPEDNTEKFQVEDMKAEDPVKVADPVVSEPVKEVVKEVVDTVVTTVKEVVEPAKSADPVVTDTTKTGTTNNDDWGSSDW